MAATELPIPSAAGLDGMEVLRAFIAGGGLQVSMVRAFESPEAWGILLADIARHAARIFAGETELSEAEALEQICDLFGREMARPTDLGTTQGQHRN